MAEELYRLIERLYPIGRSLTGPGVRETLAVLQHEVGVELEPTEVPTGTPLYDWTVPQEWRVREAYIATLKGRRVIDIAESNLHVVGYSTAVRERMPRERLDAHLHSLPDQPDLVPYRTSYYGDTWGFCIAQRVRQQLTDAEYDVVIDSEHIDGALSLAEAHVAGESTDEVLLSCNTCHPSLANDGVSAIALNAILARELARTTPRLTYRFLFSPGTLRSARVARTERGSPRPHRLRARDLMCGRQRSRDLQALAARSVQDGSRGSGRARAARSRPSARAVRSVGRRRAAVLLAGLRPAGRRPFSNSSRRVPRIPHLSR